MCAQLVKILNLEAIPCKAIYADHIIASTLKQKNATAVSASLKGLFNCRFYRTFLTRP